MEVKTFDFVTYADIAKANNTIKTTTIVGKKKTKDRYGNERWEEVAKEYSEVNQRVSAFRQVYPTGFITTTIISHENGVIHMRAEVGFYAVYSDTFVPVVLATGDAYEKEDSSQVNRTSYIENCQTSAWGRALGAAGFGIDTSICSAEELKNALHQQEQTAQPQAPKPAEKPAPVPKAEPKPVVDSETEYRKLALQAFSQKQLDASCKRKFGTKFAETPVEQLKTVMPEDMLRAQIDKKAKEAQTNE